MKIKTTLVLLCLIAISGCQSRVHTIKFTEPDNSYHEILIVPVATKKENISGPANNNFIKLLNSRIQRVSENIKENLINAGINARISSTKEGNSEPLILFISFKSYRSSGGRGGNYIELAFNLFDKPKKQLLWKSVAETQTFVSGFSFGIDPFPKKIEKELFDRNFLKPKEK